MTNPQPPQWLIDAIFDWVNKSMLESPPKFDNPVLAALITAKFEQAVGKPKGYLELDEWIGTMVGRSAAEGFARGYATLQYEAKKAWYTDASREGEKDE